MFFQNTNCMNFHEIPALLEHRLYLRQSVLFSGLCERWYMGMLAHNLFYVFLSPPLRAPPSLKIMPQKEVCHSNNKIQIFCHFSKICTATCAWISVQELIFQSYFYLKVTYTRKCRQTVKRKENICGCQWRSPLKWIRADRKRPVYVTSFTNSSTLDA